MADINDRKAELIAEIERARSRASANRQAMEGTSSRASAKAGATVARHRYSWIFGAILAGFAIAKIPPRTKKVVVNRRGEAVKNGNLEAAGKAGFAMAILKLLIDITKPIIMAWATKRLGEAVHVGKQVRSKVERVERRT